MKWLDHYAMDDYSIMVIGAWLVVTCQLTCRRLPQLINTRFTTSLSIQSAKLIRHRNYVTSAILTQRVIYINSCGVYF